MSILAKPKELLPRLYTFFMQDASEWQAECEAVFAKAAEVREQREELKAGIGNGELLLGEALSRSEAEEGVADIKLLSLMDCVPGLGKVKGRRLLGDLGWTETVKLGEVAEEQRRELLSRLADHGCDVGRDV